MTVLKSLCVSLLLWLALVGGALAVDRVDINTADSATLDRVLINIGPAKAAAIVAYRRANGAFRSADQLALVKGVGLKTIEKNRDRIDIGSAGVPQRGPGTRGPAVAPTVNR